MVVLKIPNLTTGTENQQQSTCARCEYTHSLIKPTAGKSLERPSDRGDDAENASGDVSLGEHGDGVDEAC